MPFGGILGRLAGHAIGHALDLDDDDREGLARGLGLIGMVATFDLAESALQMADVADALSSGSDVAASSVDAAHHAASGSDVMFGEGRWTDGIDHNGYHVAQSSTGPPYYTDGPYKGQAVSPTDVTWHN